MRLNNSYLNISFKDPLPIAQCDRTGFIVMHKDLVWQMEYYGNGLRNTGWLVHKKFVDKPNPQLMVPPIYKDPQPVPNARPIKIPNWGYQ